MRRRWTLVLAAALTLLALGATAALAARPAAKQAGSTVNVTMKDFKFVFSASSAKKGTVTFKLKNTGKTGHDLKINGKTSAVLGAGKSGTLKVTFKKAGKYPYKCTVDSHAALGMKGTFTIK
jgi:plastocyanin